MDPLCGRLLLFSRALYYRQRARARASGSIFRSGQLRSRLKKDANRERQHWFFNEAAIHILTDGDEIIQSSLAKYIVDLGLIVITMFTRANFVSTVRCNRAENECTIHMSHIENNALSHIFFFLFRIFA